MSIALEENWVTACQSAVCGCEDWRRLVIDLALRQGLLELLDASGGDLSVEECQLFKLRQPLQMHQSSVVDPGVGEAHIHDGLISINFDLTALLLNSGNHLNGCWLGFFSALAMDERCS